MRELIRMLIISTVVGAAVLAVEPAEAKIKFRKIGGDVGRVFEKGKQNIQAVVRDINSCQQGN